MRGVILITFLACSDFSFGQTRSEKLFREANDEFLSRNYRAALDLYDQAITADSSNTDAFFWRGMTKVQLVDLEGHVLILIMSLKSILIIMMLW